MTQNTRSAWKVIEREATHGDNGPAPSDPAEHAERSLAGGHAPRTYEGPSQRGTDRGRRPVDGGLRTDRRRPADAGDVEDRRTRGRPSDPGGTGRPRVRPRDGRDLRRRRTQRDRCE